MMRHKTALLAALFLGRALLTYAGETPQDVVFKALGDELKRSMTLRLEDLDAPYFVQYEISDSTTYRVTSAYGALLSSDQSRSRVLVSQVRVGSADLDNSNFAGGRGGGGRSGLGSSTQLPTEDDYLAIRQAIWRATDWQFKDALETLTRKRSYLKERTVEDRPPDFTKADPVVALKEPARLTFDRARWEDYARRLSASLRNLAQIEDSAVDLVAGLENRYLVNSEGSRLRDGQSECLLRITFEGQAGDGQWLSDHLSYFAPSPDELPPADKVVAEVGKAAERLGQAIKGEVLDDYSGPVLFDGLAATQLFRQLLGSGIIGSPDPVGAPRRSAQGGEDLDSRIGKRILPATFQIYDDPRQTKFEDTFLAGYYQTDDEAVPAQRVNIVVDGKLEGMVLSRAPTKRFSQSNGHGRRGGGESPRPALGCLYIESSKGLDPDDLKKELLQAADREGLKFALRVSGLQSRSGGLGPVGRFRRGGGAARMVGDPIYAYKVYVSDGHEEPVRGCEFTSLDLQSLRKILATGKVRTVQNNIIGATPSSSIIAPAVVIGELELSRIKSEGEKKPILAAPQARANPSSLHESRQ
jgi:hypothetical protein